MSKRQTRKLRSPHPAYPMTSMPSTRLPVCECTTVRHEHGTRNMYSYHRCPCAPCKDASRAHRAKARGAGIDWVDAAPARARLELLIDAGLTMAAIADLCAADLSQMYALRNGRRGKPVARVRVITLNSLLAIKTRDVASYELPAGAKISGDSARNQLQALYCLGWSVDSLHEEGGLAKSALRGLRDGDRTTEEFRLKVDTLYRRLRGRTAPQATELDRIRYSNALARAAANEWNEFAAEDAA